MIVCARFLLCIAFLLSTVCHFSFARRPDRTDDSASEKSVVFNAEDITHLTLYGPNAVYLSDSCPKKFKFTNRARQLPELAEDKVGIFPEDIVVNGKKCSSDATMLVFQPIGKPSHFPPQCTHFLPFLQP